MANPRYFTWSRKPLVESIAQREKKNRSRRFCWTSFDLFASTSHHHDTSRCVQSYNLLSRPKCSDSRFLAANYKRKTRLKRRTKYQPCPCCIFKFSVSLIVIKNNMFWIKFVLKFSIYPDEIFFSCPSYIAKNLGSFAYYRARKSFFFWQSVFVFLNSSVYSGLQGWARAGAWGGYLSYYRFPLH